MRIYLTEQQLVENPGILRTLKADMARHHIQISRNYFRGVNVVTADADVVTADAGKYENGPKEKKNGWNEGSIPYRLRWLSKVAGIKVDLNREFGDASADDTDAALLGMMDAAISRGDCEDNRIGYDEMRDKWPGMQTFEFKDISFDVVKDGTVRHVEWDRRCYSADGGEYASVWAEKQLLNDIRYYDAPVVAYAIGPRYVGEPDVRKLGSADGNFDLAENEFLFWNTAEGYEIRNIEYTFGQVWDGCPDGISPLTRSYWENLGLGAYFDYIVRYRIGPGLDAMPEDAWMNFPNEPSGRNDFTLTQTMAKTAIAHNAPSKRVGMG